MTLHRKFGIEGHTPQNPRKIVSSTRDWSQFYTDWNPELPTCGTSKIRSGSPLTVPAPMSSTPHTSQFLLYRLESHVGNRRNTYGKDSTSGISKRALA